MRQVTSVRRMQPYAQILYKPERGGVRVAGECSLEQVVCSSGAAQ